MQIKTLSEILAQMDKADICADSRSHQDKKSQQTQSKPIDGETANIQTNQPKRTQAKFTNKTQPTAQKYPNPKTKAKSLNKKPQSHKSTDINPKNIDQVQSTVNIRHAQDAHPTPSMNEKMTQLLQSVAIEPITAEHDKATRYMRWLAFYYLSNRELSQHQLRQKLLDKGCDPDAVNALIIEFATKGYQSDERCAQMLIRESIRKNRGKQHILRALKSAKISLPDGLDEQITQAGIETLTDGTVLSDDESEQVDWLRLAVEARCKKYGDSIPSTPKDKAKQLRFLQYRGFDTSVCFDALKYRLEDFG